MRAAKSDQSLNVADVVFIAAFPPPIQLIDRIRRSVAVPIAAFRPIKLLAAVQKRNALRQQNDRRRQLLPLPPEPFRLIMVGRLHLIPKRMVVMAFDVIDRLTRVAKQPAERSQAPGNGELHLFSPAWVAEGESPIRQMKGAPFHRIAKPVIKIREARQLIGVGHRRLLFRRKGRRQVPPFPIHKDRWIDGVEGIAHRLHRLDIVHAHQIKAEPIKAVFFRPKHNRIDDPTARHPPLRSDVVADACAVGRLAIGVVAEVIAGNELLKRRLLPIVDMVVDRIHHDAQSIFVQRVDRLLQFYNACVWIRWIGRITPFRRI
ncbi:hypothetical protein LR69_04237 [Geobacillus sp. BCO2]|nr:hypothetical protein LR69_04237 [Geobacillus sp. BCO2]